MTFSEPGRSPPASKWSRPPHYQALLREAPYDVDPDTKNPEVANAWLGYSASGEVTAPVVYAHSGNPEDYDVLRKNGIDVKGKIVLGALFESLQLSRIQSPYRGKKRRRGAC